MVYNQFLKKTNRIAHSARLAAIPGNQHSRIYRDEQDRTRE